MRALAEGSSFKQLIDPLETGLSGNMAFIIGITRIVITGVLSGPAVSTIFSFNLISLVSLGVNLILGYKDVPADVVVVVEVLQAVGTVKVRLRIDGCADLACPLCGDDFFTVLEILFSVF